MLAGIRWLVIQIKMVKKVVLFNERLAHVLGRVNVNLTHSGGNPGAN